MNNCIAVILILKVFYTCPKTGLGCKKS